MLLTRHFACLEYFQKLQMYFILSPLILLVTPKENTKTTLVKVSIICQNDGEVTWVGADKFDKFGWKDLSQISNENKAVLVLPKNAIFLSKNENAQKFEWSFKLHILRKP